jgi:hypothetical protein
VYEVFQEEWASVKFAMQSAEHAVVGVAFSGIWLILFKDSHKRGDWLRPVTGWPAETAEIREWEKVTGADMEAKAMSVDRPQGLIEGSGQRGEQRRLDQMVSARLDPMLVAAVKEYAKRHGVSVSDVFREAATQLLQRDEARNVVTFRVDVTNETRPDGISRKSYQTDIPMAVLQASRLGLLPLGPRYGRHSDPSALRALRSKWLATERRKLHARQGASVSAGCYRPFAPRRVAIWN